jgi:hypothetical protein
MLEQIDPAAARDFATDASVVLGCLEPQAQRLGLLNRSGSPVEFTFSTLSQDLRYTLELGWSGVPPEDRLQHARRLLKQLGFSPEWKGALQYFAEVQRNFPLRWGAWLGVRTPFLSKNLQSQTVRHCKIYAEVPVASDGERLRQQYMGSVPIPSEEQARLVMVGGSPQSDGCEFYFAIQERSPRRAWVEDVLSCAGLSAFKQQLADLICSMEFRTRREPSRLPPAHYGFSYSFPKRVAMPRVSFFVLAVDLAGDDRFLRRQALRLSQRVGVSLGAYDPFTQDISNFASVSSLHNMFAFTADAKEGVGVQVFLSPPVESKQ